MLLSGHRLWAPKKIQLIAVAVAVTALVLGLPSVEADPELTWYEEFRQQVAQEMVENAIMAFDADAESALMAIQDTDNMLFHDGELYVFVLDDGNVLVAHGATPDLVGSDFDEIFDTQGTNIGELFTANRSPYGKWVEYYWPNPTTETEESELKISWNKFHAGYTFGVGIYPGNEKGAGITLTDADRERQRAAVEMTEQAIAAFGRDRDAAIAAVQDPDNRLYHDVELYVNIANDKNVLVAHGTTPELIGVDLDWVSDVNGINLGELLEKNASLYGNWDNYTWPNPAITPERHDLKISGGKVHAGYTFIVGIYPGFAQGPSVELTDADRERQRAAVEMTEQAIAAFGRDRDAAIAAVQDPDNRLYHDNELYVVITDSDNVLVAHGADPGLVGEDGDDIVDAAGNNLGELFESNASSYGRWVENYRTNPATESDEEVLKYSWAKTGYGHVFIVGIYPGFAQGPSFEPIRADMERQRIAVAMTNQAIDAFVADKESAISAIQDPDNALYHDGELYVFVWDENNVAVAHGATPSLVGTDFDGVEDTHGTNIGELFTANRSPYGKWVEYYWPNPATETDESELKLSWIKFHAGHTFGVGIYPEQADAMMTSVSP